MKTSICKLSILFILFAVLLGQVNIAASQGESHVYLPVIRNCIDQIQGLTNGDFELGPTGWLIDHFGMASIENATHGFVPLGGNWMGFLPSAIYGGYNSSLHQFATIPDSYPYLSFWWTAETECGPVSGDRCATYLRITINEIQVTLLSGELSQPWHNSTIDLSAYHGQFVLLGFENTNYRDSTYIALDNFTFQSCP